MPVDWIIRSRPRIDDRAGGSPAIASGSDPFAIHDMRVSGRIQNFAWKISRGAMAESLKNIIRLSGQGATKWRMEDVGRLVELVQQIEHLRGNFLLNGASVD